jgi:hypothetical protein
MENNRYRLKQDRQVDRRTKVLKTDILIEVWHDLDNDQMMMKVEKTGDQFTILKSELIKL